MKKMRGKFNFIDPEAIMGVIVALVILAVGVFAFFTVVDTIPIGEPNSTGADQSIQDTIDNLGETGSSVFDIIGVVVILTVMMTIIGAVYHFVRPSYSDTSYSDNVESTAQMERRLEQQRQERERVTIQQQVEKARKKRKQEIKKREERKKQKRERQKKKYYTKNRTSRMAKAAELMDKQKGKKSKTNKRKGG